MFWSTTPGFSDVSTADPFVRERARTISSIMLVALVFLLSVALLIFAVLISQVARPTDSLRITQQLKCMAFFYFVFGVPSFVMVAICSHLTEKLNAILRFDLTYLLAELMYASVYVCLVLWPIMDTFRFSKVQLPDDISIPSTGPVNNFTRTQYFFKKALRDPELKEEFRIFLQKEFSV
eukprot:Ihof_evm1s753 gene=Ihof_evmTU1s753